LGEKREIASFINEEQPSLGEKRKRSLRQKKRPKRGKRKRWKRLVATQVPLDQGGQKGGKSKGGFTPPKVGVRIPKTRNPTEKNS